MVYCVIRCSSGGWYTVLYGVVVEDGILCYMV